MFVWFDVCVICFWVSAVGWNQKRECWSAAESRVDYARGSLHRCVTVMGVSPAERDWMLDRPYLAMLFHKAVTKSGLGFCYASFFQPAFCKPHRLALGFWLQLCLSHPSPERKMVFPPQTGTIDCRVRSHIISSPYWTARSFIQSALAVCTANGWHLNCSWHTPTGLELAVSLMATLQMAFHSWLINAIKHRLLNEVKSS